VRAPLLEVLTCSRTCNLTWHCRKGFRVKKIKKKVRSCVYSTWLCMCTDMAYGLQNGNRMETLPSRGSGETNSTAWTAESSKALSSVSNGVPELRMQVRADLVDGVQPAWANLRYRPTLEEVNIGEGKEWGSGKRWSRTSIVGHEILARFGEQIRIKSASVKEIEGTVLRLCLRGITW
jgi:hypothetical protein